MDTHVSLRFCSFGNIYIYIYTSIYRYIDIDNHVLLRLCSFEIGRISSAPSKNTFQVRMWNTVTTTGSSAPKQARRKKESETRPKHFPILPLSRPSTGSWSWIFKAWMIVIRTHKSIRYDHTHTSRSHRIASPGRLSCCPSITNFINSSNSVSWISKSSCV